MEALLAIPAVLITIGAVIGGTITGFFYFIGLFGKAKSQNTKQAEDANQYVIKSLQQKVQVLEDTLLIQQKAIAENTKELVILKGENKTLQELVLTALEAYFQNNPKVASNINTTLQ